MGSLVSISLRVSVPSLSIPVGVLYIVPLFDSILMLSVILGLDPGAFNARLFSDAVCHA